LNYPRGKISRSPKIFNTTTWGEFNDHVILLCLYNLQSLLKLVDMYFRWRGLKFTTTCLRPLTWRFTHDDMAYLFHRIYQIYSCFTPFSYLFQWLWTEQRKLRWKCWMQNTLPSRVLIPPHFQMYICFLWRRIRVLQKTDFRSVISVQNWSRKHVSHIGLQGCTPRWSHVSFFIINFKMSKNDMVATKLLSRKLTTC